MLESHPDIETPESSTSIWRYMAIEKFLHLLTSASLWFSRCDYFEDGWEGRYSDATYQTFLKSFNGPEDKIRDFWNWHQDWNHEIRKCLYINCWHINDEESAALWQIHSTYGNTVAIKTTMHRLRDAIADTELSILCGRVKYADYANESMPMDNLFTPFLRKRRSFYFENEMRLLYWNTDLTPTAKDTADAKSPAGAIIPVKLDPLIEMVYVSPQADTYVRDALSALLEKFEFSRAKIVQSKLFAGPV